MLISFVISASSKIIPSSELEFSSSSPTISILFSIKALYSSSKESLSTSNPFNASANSS